MNKLLWKRSVLASTALATLTLAPSVIAQDAEEQASGSAAILMEEIQVYGTKRSTAEAAQDVAAQVAAFGARQLEARQVVTVEDLSFSTPSVSLDTIGTSPGVANFSIRGLGVNSSIPSVDPAVGLFVDGMYYGINSGVVSDTFDLESVEIYKGPQGVLFGRNVTGGAVVMRTRRPDGETRVRGKIGYDDNDSVTLAGSVEGAIVEDRLYAKVTGYYKDGGGYVFNPTVDRDVGEEESLFIRPTIVYEGDGFNATLIYEHGSFDGDSAIAQATRGNSPSSVNSEIATIIDEPGTFDSDWDNLIIEASAEVGNGTLTNIFTMRDYSGIGSSDIDAVQLTLFHADFDTQQDQISNELRYNGNMSDRWELTAGLFYFQQDLVAFERRRGLAFAAAPGGSITGGGVQDHSTWGIFLSNDFDVSDKLTLTVGGRYSKEDKEVTISRLGACNWDTRQCAGVDAEDDWSSFTPKIGFSYLASDDVQYYGHYTKGFRSGGYNFRTPLTAPPATDPEKIDSFELGMKSDLADGRVRLNAAAYFTKISDMQREINLSDPTVGVFQDIRNTADAEIKGLEVDMLALLTENFALNASLGYTDGDYTEILSDISGDGAINQTDLDLRIPRLSKWTLNFGGTYDIDLGDNGIIAMRANYAYRSSTAYTDNNLGLFDSYDMIDASISYEPVDGKWRLAVYAKNLGDTAVLGNVTVLPFAALGFSESTYFAPQKAGRRFGAELSFEF